MNAGLRRQYALHEIEGLGYFQSVAWIPSVDSTNKRLAQSVRNSATSLPALLVADEQTTGVGRGSNQWWSPTGCLMFTMAIPVGAVGQLGAVDQSACIRSELLPLRVGYAVAECLEGISSARPMVKWPNDVYIAGRKVSGVLIEVLPRPLGQPSVAIIGIGINCWVDFTDAPADLRAHATSLHTWVKSGAVASVSTESVLVAFIHQWLNDQQREVANPNWFLERWPERSLLDGQWVEVKHSFGLTQGLCIGIKESGAILIQNEQLEVVEVLAGTVESFRPLHG